MGTVPRPGRQLKCQCLAWKSRSQVMGSTWATRPPCAPLHLSHDTQVPHRDAVSAAGRHQPGCNMGLCTTHQHHMEAKQAANSLQASFTDQLLHGGWQQVSLHPAPAPTTLHGIYPEEAAEAAAAALLQGAMSTGPGSQRGTTGR